MGDPSDRTLHGDLHPSLLSLPTSGPADPVTVRPDPWPGRGVGGTEPPRPPAPHTHTYTHTRVWVCLEQEGEEG